jgi:hypothetical protein
MVSNPKKGRKEAVPQARIRRKWELRVPTKKILIIKRDFQQEKMADSALYRQGVDNMRADELMKATNISRDELRVIIAALKWHGQDDTVDVPDRKKSKRLARLLEQTLIKR